MLKNKIPLCLFIGTNIIVLGILLLTVNVSIHSSVEKIMRNEESMISFAIFTTLGISFLAAGFGLVFRKNWARVVLNIFLFILIILFSVIVYFFIIQVDRYFNWRHAVQQISLLACLASLIAGTFLFINNVRVVKELNSKETE